MSSSTSSMENIMQVTSDRSASSSPWMRRTSWLFSFLVVAQMLSSAWVRSTNHAYAVTEIVSGYGYPESAITRIVIAEIVLVIFYLIPQTSVLAAIVLTGYLGGAIAAHVRVGDLPRAIIPLLVAMLAWGGLYLRDPRLRQLLPFRRSA